MNFSLTAPFAVPSFSKIAEAICMACGSIRMSGFIKEFTFS